MSTNRKRNFSDSAADEKIEDETIVQTTPYLNDTNIKILEIDNQIGEVQKKIDEVEIEISEINEEIKKFQNLQRLSQRKNDTLKSLREKEKQLRNKEEQLRNKEGQLRNKEGQLRELNIISLKARTATGHYCIISSVQEILIYSLYFPSFIMIIGPSNRITHQISSGSQFVSPGSHVLNNENFACKFAKTVQTFSIFNPLVKVFVCFQNAVPLEGTSEDIISLMKNNCKALGEDFEKIERLLLINESSSCNSLTADFTQLQSMAEDLFQKKYLTRFSCMHPLDKPHQKHKCAWLDTHKTPHKTICVSLVNPNTETMNFEAKPDLVSCHVPLYVEVKKYGCKVIKEELLEADFELLLQGIERVTQVFQFRGYLSKFMVVLSNGVHSFFMLYQHIINDADRRPDHSFQLHIIPIDTKSVNKLVTGIIEAAKVHGPEYYLTPHGALILNALKSMVPDNVSVYKVRVQYLTSSCHSLYFITEPSDNGKVNAKTKSYVFKVNLELESYNNELDLLTRYTDKRTSSSDKNWNGYEQGFELRHSFSVKANTQRATGRHVWFESIPPVCVTGGVLATTAGVRSINHASVDALHRHIIIKDLHKHLKYIHSKKLLHTDIRPDNIVHFPSIGWRIIDFDCAVIASSESGVTNVKVQKGSSRYNFSSNRVQDLGKNVIDGGWYTADNYSKDDDTEMLNKAIKHMCDAINLTK